MCLNEETVMHTPLLATGRRLATRICNRGLASAQVGLCPPSPRSTESCAVYSAGIPQAFGPTFSHHLHKTIRNLLYQMHNHFQIAVLGLLSLKSLVSLVALPGVVGLVALEGLVRVSFPFYPF